MPLRRCRSEPTSIRRRATLVAWAVLSVVGVAACSGGPARATVPPSQPPPAPPPAPLVSPGPPPPGLVKAPLQGLSDRGALGAFKLPSGALAGAVQAIVANVRWADIQPSPGGPIVRGPSNQLDVARQQVRDHNAANPTHPLQLKLRFFAGVDAPDWAKTLGGFRPVPIENRQAAAAGTGQQLTIGPFWRTDYQAAYADVQRKLAALYDTDPLLRDVTISGCMTVYAEPFQRDDTGFSALYAQGYTVAQDEACLRTEIDAHRVWTHTHSSLAVNPWRPWIAQADGAVVQARPDESLPLQVMRYCRTQLVSRCTLESNSLRLGAPAGSQTIDGEIKALGPAITIQTATAARVGDIHQVVLEAIRLGANAVELPGAYDRSEMAPDAAGLVANRSTS